ncbi:MAG TPA: STAS domain-containing protein [Ignavibacteriaceae bacterium]|nr:STAS domain-containing protein [Ignavibacteriaceae bacterium]
MEDFKKTIFKDIIVETVNLTRATYKEAGLLRHILNQDIIKGFRKMVIDLSQCEFIDSTFIGVLVITLKEVAKISGELRIVQPKSIANTILAKSGTINIFNVADTVEQALKSFEFGNSQYLSKSEYVFPLKVSQ